MKRELTVKEYLELDNYLHKCGWVRRGCRVFFDDDCYYGKYISLSDEIRIRNHPRMIMEMTPCVIHELTHRQQRRRMGLIKYSLLNLTRFILEKEARQNEVNAEITLGIEL